MDCSYAVEGPFALFWRTHATKVPKVPKVAFGDRFRNLRFWSCWKKLRFPISQTPFKTKAAFEGFGLCCEICTSRHCRNFAKWAQTGLAAVRHANLDLASFGANNRMTGPSSQQTRYLPS